MSQLRIQHLNNNHNYDRKKLIEQIYIQQNLQLNHLMKMFNRWLGTTDESKKKVEWEKIKFILAQSE